MKKYRLSEALGRVDPKYIQEVFDYTEDGGFCRKGAAVNRKKIIAVAAAAVIAVSATVTTAFAAANGFAALKNLFARNSPDVGENPSAGNLPLADIEEIGDGQENMADDFMPGDFRLISSVCDEYSFLGVVEFNAAGYDIPENLEEDSPLHWGVTTNQAFGRSPIVSFESRDGDILTYVIRITEEGRIPESFTVYFGENGYADDDSWYVGLCGNGRGVTVDTAGLNVVKAVESAARVDGIIDIKAKLVPLGLILLYDPAQIEEWEAETGDQWLRYSMSRENAFLKIEMRDGTVFEQNYDFAYGYDAYRDPDAGETGIRISFAVPLETDKVAKITYCGTEFVF